MALLDRKWELMIQGHRCVCKVRAGLVYATITGPGFLATRSCDIGGDARAAALRMCETVVRERVI